MPVWLMSLAAMGLAAIWATSGAARWNGYPVDYRGGVAVTWVIAVLVQAVLLGVGLLALGREAPTRRALIAAIACWTLARLATASCVPLGSDEAYYWLWSRQLDLGYYDHPGLVAWLARLLAPWGGQATAAVRLTGIVSGAALPAAAYCLTRATVGDGAAARRVGLLAMLLPVFAANFLLLPNMPADLLWVITAWLVWRACRRERLGDWALAGAVFGLALDAKFTVLSLPAGVLAFLVVSRGDRRNLVRAGPYAAIATALITFAPTLVWNARHGWATFALHFVRRQHALAFHPEWLLSFVAVSALLLSPVIAVWAAGPGILAAWRSRGGGSCGELFLACLAFTPLLTTLVISATQRAHAHQVAAAYVPLLGLFVGRTTTAGSVGRWYVHGGRVALVITMLAFAAYFVPALTPLPLATKIHRILAPRDPAKMTAEVLGWSALGRFLEAERQRDGAIVIGPSYAQAALAAQYGAAGHVYSMDEGRSPYGQQIGIWNSLGEVPRGTDAVLFRTGHGAEESAYEADIGRLFERIERFDTGAADPRLRYFAIWRGIGWRGGYRPGSAWGPAANGEE